MYDSRELTRKEGWKSKGRGAPRTLSGAGRQPKTTGQCLGHIEWRAAPGPKLLDSSSSAVVARHPTLVPRNVMNFSLVFRLLTYLELNDFLQNSFDSQTQHEIIEIHPNSIKKQHSFARPSP